MRSRAWMDEAACAGLPPRTADALFFGRIRQGYGQMFTRRDLDRARQVCERCPVLFACLDDALSVPHYIDRYGIRAGLLPEERATLRDGPPVPRDVAVRAYLGGEPAKRSNRRPRAASL